AFTGLFGALAFAKAWHFEERNLPFRLQEYLDRISDEHLRDRSIFLGPYATRNLRGDATPVIETRFLDKLLLFFRVPPTEKRRNELMGSVEMLDTDIQVLSRKLSGCSDQRITAHIIQAQKLLSRDMTDDALKEVDKARAINPTDLDALEHQAKI